MKELILHTFVIGIGTSMMMMGCSGFGTSTPVSDADVRDIQRTAAESAAQEREARALFEARSQDWSRLTREGREHMKLGERDLAEQSFRSAYQISSRFRASDVRRKVSLGNLERIANRYKAAGVDVSAARVIEFIASETLEAKGTSYPGLSDLLITLGDIYATRGAVESAESAYQRALELKVQRNGINSTALLEIYQKLGAAEIRLKNPSEALEITGKRIQLAELYLGHNDPEVLEARMQRATAYQMADQFPQAEADYLRALDGFRSIQPDSAKVAILQNAIAFLYLGMKKVDEAYPRVEEALRIFDANEIRGIAKANVLDTKAQILAAQGNPEAASATFERVMAESNDASPRERISLYESFETFLIDQHRIAEAGEIRNRINRTASEIERTLLESQRDLSPLRAPNASRANFDSGAAASDRSERSVGAGAAAVSPPAVQTGPPTEPTPVKAQWDDDSTDIYMAAPH